ncbi:hypothetical protein MMC25_005603 [Agyrium rufum]|nr:hypothetical protein [Agyrium rufum]
MAATFTERVLSIRDAISASLRQPIEEEITLMRQKELLKQALEILQETLESIPLSQVVEEAPLYVSREIVFRPKDSLQHCGLDDQNITPSISVNKLGQRRVWTALDRVGYYYENDRWIGKTVQKFQRKTTRSPDEVELWVKRMTVENKRLQDTILSELDQSSCIQHAIVDKPDEYPGYYPGHRELYGDAFITHFWAPGSVIAFHMTRFVTGDDSEWQVSQQKEAGTAIHSKRLVYLKDGGITIADARQSYQVMKGFGVMSIVANGRWNGDRGKVIVDQNHVQQPPGALYYPPRKVHYRSPNSPSRRREGGSDERSDDGDGTTSNGKESPRKQHRGKKRKRCLTPRVKAVKTIDGDDAGQEKQNGKLKTPHTKTNGFVDEHSNQTSPKQTEMDIDDSIEKHEPVDAIPRHQNGTAIKDFSNEMLGTEIPFIIPSQESSRESEPD